MNREVKHRAAFLGLCLFLLQWIAPPLERMAYERTRLVAATEMNLYAFDFAAHWADVSALFRLTEETRLERFEAGYSADGTLLHMRYEGVERRPEGHYDYVRAELDPDKSAFRIKRSRVEQWVQFDRSIAIRRFFRQLDATELASLRPGTDFPYYGLSAKGSSVNFGIKDSTTYILEESGLARAIANDSLPVQGFWLRSCADRSLPPQGRVGCGERTDYILDAVRRER